MSWRVTYVFAPGLAVANPIAGYPSLGIAFDYDSEGNLIGLRHILELASPDPTAAKRTSEIATRTLFEAIEFLYGLPPHIVTTRAEDLNSSAGVKTGFISIPSNAAIVAPIVFPSEVALASAPTRLAVRLHLLNLARNSATDAIAVYLYYIIWEDMHGRPTSADANTAQGRLKFTRDFVSHGEALGSAAPKAFIESKTKGSIVAFDPNRGHHAALVAAQRAEARTLVEAELRAML